MFNEPKELLFPIKRYLKSIECILEYVEDHDFEAFCNNYMVIDAVIRNFEIIGEASKGLPNAIKSQYPEIPWEKIYHLRNVVSHEYFGIDNEMIWQIIKEHLPENRNALIMIIEREGND